MGRLTDRSGGGFRMLGWTLVRTRKWQALQADLRAARKTVDAQRDIIVQLRNEVSKLRIKER